METVELDRWLALFVRDRLRPADVDDWVEHIGSVILASSPVARDDAALTALVTTSVRAQWTAFLAQLQEPRNRFVLVQPAAEVAVDLARRGEPLPVLLRIYRDAQRAVWEYVGAAIGAGPVAPRDPAAALLYLWSRASAWLDAAIEESIELFTEEQERIRQGSNARLLQVVRDLLDGTSPYDARAAGVQLGFGLDGRHVALLLHADEPNAVADLTAAADRLARRLRSRSTLVVNPGGRDLWCWFALGEGAWTETLDGARGALTKAGLTVAAGAPGSGIDGFVRSHREAHEAQRLMFRSAALGPVTRYDDVEALVLVGTAPAAAERFVVRRLGDLAGTDETSTRLRATLEVLLRTGSVDAAARELVVHRNTVRYRVAQAEERLGRALDGDTAELALALRYFSTVLA
ncbi:MAG: helix-turn-helix domain-containing protein [Nocardioidaceae bacterium]|nr:helix-turn-helix domain-containing protein [Nocardioidaceae bacterium]